MAHDLGKLRDCPHLSDAVVEIAPEGKAELAAGFLQTSKGIAATASQVATGSAADLAPFDVAADVVLATVGVQRDLRAQEHKKQFFLVVLDAFEERIERGPAGR